MLLTIEVLALKLVRYSLIIATLFVASVMLNGIFSYYQRHKYKLKALPKVWVTIYLTQPYLIILGALAFLASYWYVQLIALLYILLVMALVLRRYPLKMRVNTKIVRAYIYVAVVVVLVGLLIGYYYEKSVEYLPSFLMLMTMALPLLTVFALALCKPIELILIKINKKRFCRRLRTLQPKLILVPQIKEGLKEDLFVAMDFAYKVVPVSCDNYLEDIVLDLRNTGQIILVDTIIEDEEFKHYQLAFIIKGSDLSAFGTTVETTTEKLSYQDFDRKLFKTVPDRLAYGFEYKEEAQ